MGFIEDLRRQKAEEEQGQLMIEQDAKRARIENQDRIKNEKMQRNAEKKIRDEKWKKAKRHFNQSGVREMLEDVVTLKGAESISENKDNKVRNYDLKQRQFIVNTDELPHEIFSLTLVVRRSESKMSSVSISANADGDIVFSGKDEIRIPRISWQEDRLVLEEALRKTYINPSAINFDTSKHWGIDFTNGMSSG